MYQKVPKRTRLLVLCSVGFVAILLAILSLAVEDSREQPLANEIAFDIANHESLGSVEVSYLRKMGVVLNGFVESDEALSELQSIVSKHACEGDRIHLDMVQFFSLLLPCSCPSGIKWTTEQEIINYSPPP